MEMQLREVPQVELQQDLLRFAGLFSERVEQAAEPLSDIRDPRRTADALHRALLYEAHALEIATGPSPGVDALDMAVFITLCREAFERHWLPHVYGAAGRDMFRALETSEADAWTIAGKVLSSAQEDLLREQVRAWQAENPAQVHVEAVRLADFSKLHGDAAKNAAASGLLASVKSATRTADDALRLGERALFLAQRAPFSLRLQVRIGTLELMAEAGQQVARLDVAAARAESLARRCSVYLTLIGVIWVVIFWLGYYLAR